MSFSQKSLFKHTVFLNSAEDPRANMATFNILSLSSIPHAVTFLVNKLSEIFYIYLPGFFKNIISLFDLFAYNFDLHLFSNEVFVLSIHILWANVRKNLDIHNIFHLFKTNYVCSQLFRYFKCAELFVSNQCSFQRKNIY